METTPPSSRKSSLTGKVLIAAILAGAVALGLHEYKIPFPGFQQSPAPSSQAQDTLVPVSIESPFFDRAVRLPATASGVTWNNAGFLFLLPGQPAEVLQLKPARTFFELQRHSLSEIHGLNFHTWTWNGSEIIGFGESGFFSTERGFAFTVHDPATFQIRETHPAPDLMCGLAWDGGGYWAASKIRDPQTQKDSYLYRLDKNFQTINRLISPVADCQGLVWDGSFLWITDRETGRVLVLNMKGPYAQAIRTFETNLKSPGGIAYDGESVWVLENGQNQFLRFTPDRKQRPAPRFASLRRELPSEEKLPDFSSYLGSNEYPRDAVEINEVSCQFLGDDLYLSWQIYFGDQLLAASTFAKYTVTIYGDRLQAPIVKVYKPFPGQNDLINELLARNVPPGTYKAGLFIYVQYRDEKGVHRVLTKTIPNLSVTNG